MESPAGTTDDVGKGHGQVGLTLGALILVLLEHDRIEAGTAMVQRVEPFTEAGDVLARRERQRESHAVHVLAIAELADRAIDGAVDRAIGCPPAGHSELEPARSTAVSHKAVAVAVANGETVERHGPAGCRSREARLRGREVAAIDSLPARLASRGRERTGLQVARVHGELEGDILHPGRGSNPQRHGLAGDGNCRKALLGVDRVRMAGSQGAVADHRATPNSTASRRYMP